MNDRHESSRAAFEAAYSQIKLARRKFAPLKYLDRETQIEWKAWTRALDYAAEHQAQQPTPLPRPDRPGWWWEWRDDADTWIPQCIEEAGKGHVIAFDDGTLVMVRDGLWLPATPPPAPTIKEGER